MKLDDLAGFGFYVNAGFVDYYDGKRHHRVGEVGADGLVAFTDAGRKIANDLLTKEALRVLTAEADNQADADAARAVADAAQAAADAATAEADRRVAEANAQAAAQAQAAADKKAADEATVYAAGQARLKKAQEKAAAAALDNAEKSRIAAASTQTLSTADVGSLEDLLDMKV